MKRFTTISGIPHKLCTGPLHRPDGKWLPLDKFYKRSNGKIRSQCKACEGFHQGTEPMVPLDTVKFAITELVNRLGKAELARRLGLREATIWEWTRTRGTRQHLHRKSAKRVLELLVEVRSNGEARHVKSIHHGAKQRGHAERQVPHYYHR